MPALTSREFRYATYFFKTRNWSHQFHRKESALVPDYEQRTLYFQDKRTPAKIPVFEFDEIRRVVRGKEQISADESWKEIYVLRFESLEYTLLRLCASASAKRKTIKVPRM